MLAKDSTAASASLAVRPSTLEGAGRGLFVTAPLPRGAVITDFDGERVDRAQAMSRNPSHMRVVLYQFLYIDGLREPLPGRGWGSFANDPRDPQRVNAAFRNVWPWRGAPTPRVALCATRALRPGEEVFVSYGRDYWARLADAQQHSKCSRQNIWKQVAARAT